MVISTRAKLVITALILFFLLGVVLVTGSTKGWFVPQRFNGERVAARIQCSNNNKQRLFTLISAQLPESEFRQTAIIVNAFNFGHAPTLN
ncbi:hypothetical protein ACLKA7_015795 [Drosophila subpalustris]